MSIFGDIWQLIFKIIERRENKEKDDSLIHELTEQERKRYLEKEKKIRDKVRKISLTHFLLVVELVVILVGLTGIYVSIKDMRSRVKTAQSDIQSVKKEIIRKDFKITSPSDGDSVDRIDLIRGETPFSGMHHYVIVTPVKIGTDFVHEEAKVSLGGLWSGKAVFGAAGVGGGEEYVVRTLATNSTLSPGPLTEVPKDAIFSESITVTRKQ